MSQTGLGVQGIDTFADLDEHVLEELKVTDWTVLDDEIEHVSMDAFFKDHDRLFRFNFTPLTPLCELIIFVLRDVSRDRHSRLTDRMVDEFENVGVAVKNLVHSNLLLEAVAAVHTTLIKDFQSKGFL